jgi:hypothetical protein
VEPAALVNKVIEIFLGYQFIKESMIRGRSKPSIMRGYFLIAVSWKKFGLKFIITSI